MKLELLAWSARTTVLNKKIRFFRRIAYRVKEEELPEALVYLGFVEGDDDEFAIGGVTL